MTAIKTVCRTCLKDISRLSAIREESLVDEIPLYEILNDLLQLGVRKNDGFPEYVCLECYTNINDFMIFKKRVHAVKATLEYMKKGLTLQTEDGGSIIVKPEDVEKCDSSDSEVQCLTETPVCLSSGARSQSNLATLSIQVKRKADNQRSDGERNGGHGRDTCRKSNSRRRKAMKRKKSHQGPLICNDCGLHFSYKSKFMKHLRSGCSPHANNNQSFPSHDLEKNKARANCRVECYKENQIFHHSYGKSFICDLKKRKKMSERQTDLRTKLKKAASQYWERFSSSMSLKKHMMRTREFHCEEIFCSVSNHEEHENIHVQESEDNVGIKALSSSSGSSTFKDNCVHTEVQHFKCNCCKIKFFNHSDLEVHEQSCMKKWNEENLSEIKPEDQRSKIKSDFERHFRSHSGEKEVDFDRNEKVFSSTLAFKKHKPTPEKCSLSSTNICKPDIPISIYNLLDGGIGGKEGQEFKCFDCGANFFLESNLERHSRIHEFIHKTNWDKISDDVSLNNNNEDSDCKN